MLFNELILLLHIILIAGTTFIALRLGKSALVAFSVLQMVFANIFVLKQTTLFGMHATCADAFVVGSLLSLNILTELYGKTIAKKTIITTFVFSAFYAVMSQVHLLYIPSEIDATQEHFSKLFSVAPWLIAGSIVLFGGAQILDFILYGAFRKLWPNRLLIVRNFLALGITQIFDTVTFSFFLYWLGVITDPIQVTIVSFAIKVIIIAISTPLVTSFMSLHTRLGHTELH